jgi:hypothetical protein
MLFAAAVSLRYLNTICANLIAEGDLTCAARLILHLTFTPTNVIIIYKRSREVEIMRNFTKAENDRVDYWIKRLENPSSTLRLWYNEFLYHFANNLKHPKAIQFYVQFYTQEGAK